MGYLCESVNLDVFETIATGTSPQALRDKQKAGDAAETAARDIIDRAAAKQAATYKCDPPCENPPWYRVHTNILLKSAIELNYKHNDILQPPVYEGICIIQWWLDIKCSKPPERRKPREFYLAVSFPESETIIGPAPLSQLYLSDEEFTRMHHKRAGSEVTYCSAVVVSAKGNRCEDADCQSLVGKKHWYRCEDGKCPVRPGVWYAIPSDCGSGGTKWLTGCLVQYGNVSDCE